MKGKRIGFVLTGSFCTMEETYSAIEELVSAGAEVTPILSFNVDELDTRFQSALSIKEKLIELTGKSPLCTLQQVEPIGPKKLLDLVVVAPCTGNTMAKLANAITDTPALLAIKAHLRNQRPVLLAISSNDMLAGNAGNLGTLLARKNIFFVPFGQDDPIGKPSSMQSKYSLIQKAAENVFDGIQLQPMILSPGECLDK